MSASDNLYELLNALDPVSPSLEAELLVRQDAIWSDVVHQIQEPRVVTHVNFRRFVPAPRTGLRVLASMAAACALLVGVLAGTSPTNAMAAELKSAARADAAAAQLPALSANQYYFQQSQATLVCQFGSPSMGNSSTPLTYVATGTIDSWINSQGRGRVVINPSAVNANSSHFASSLDESRWIAAGKPFIPCALGDAANQLKGNDANKNPAGGWATSLSGYYGFGFVLTFTPLTIQVQMGANITNLPSDVATISHLLANGQINTDGSVSSSPQPCPVDNGVASSTTGCSTGQQLAIIQQLLQLPDASAKLGSVLYGVISDMPGASSLGTVNNAFGVTGNAIVVPTGPLSKFEVVINPSTGALLSATAQGSDSQSPQSFTPEGELSFGPISVVQGMNVVPVSARSVGSPSSLSASHQPSHASSVGPR